MLRAELARAALAKLHLQYPDAACTLDFQQPWHLLVAAILSAQCTDARVNQVTPIIFAQYHDLTVLATASSDDLEPLIRTCGLFRSKTKAILASSRMLMTEFGGELPRTLPELIRLPGVGRKIANLIMGDCFGIPAIVVDTHCIRISGLLGLTERNNPLAIEQDLAEVLPQDEWIAFGHMMVSHGRAICVARHPHCAICPLNDICRSAQV